jgi:PAP2 superfamily
MTQPTRSRRARWLSIPITIALLTAAILVPAASVTAAEPTDMVLEWNTNAINAIQNANGATPPGLGQVPPLAPVNLAIVHAAIYDAVNAIDGTHEPYLLDIHAPKDASQAAAAATAAHGVLVGLVPASLPQVTESLDKLYAISLGKIADGKPKSDGIVVGTAAAAVMLADRLDDGRDGTRMFPVGTKPGEWRTVPPLSNNVFSWVGEVRPFSLRSPDQIRIPAPPPLNSRKYTKEFNEVKALGAKTGSSRTPDQEALSNWIVVNPFSPVNTTFRDLATSRGLSTAQQARLFAMTSLSSADALISCWNNKQFYHFWRPQTAIQEAGTDGNRKTVADTTWESKFPTPGYPDWPSGYNCFAASMMTAGKAFFGTDRVAFDIVNASATRSYTRFSGYIHDAIEGRILIGFHFRSADELGASIGEKTAKWVARHEFGPVHH